MLTTLLVLGGTCLYLQIGRLMSNKAWDIWEKRKRTLGSFLLFPFSHLTDSVGFGNSAETEPFVEILGSKRTYLLASSLFWPWRLVLPALVVPFMGFSYVVGNAYGLASNNKIVRFCFGKIGQALLALGAPIYKLGKATFLALNEPEEAIKGLGRGIKSAVSWLSGGKAAALPEHVSEDSLPSMREELYGLLAEKEVLEQRVQELQEQICAEEAKRMGTYREPPKLMDSNQDNSVALGTSSHGPE
ncbi:hypothetical protein HYT45_00660 [Candidatus Uhrbacteria bacterium]|nr:hypothetical protein [Candidatus Uhrbacteria bacterium]